MPLMSATSYVSTLSHSLVAGRLDVFIDLLYGEDMAAAERLMARLRADRLLQESPWWRRLRLPVPLAR